MQFGTEIGASIADRISQDLSRVLERKETLRGEDIPMIIDRRSVGHEQFNCYPGVPTTACHSVALFVSLKNPHYSEGRKHLDVPRALATVVRHMQGVCPDITKHAVIICDIWEPKHWRGWRANFAQIRQDGAIIEAWLVHPRFTQSLPI